MSRTVSVILADKDSRQVPQLGHVVRLEHLALVGGAVAIQREAHATVAGVLVRERNARAQRDLANKLLLKLYRTLLTKTHAHSLAADV